MKILKQYLIIGILSLVFVVTINKYLFFSVNVPSNSMVPTINKNDRLIIFRIHDLNSIKKGDILVFYSEELNQTLIKRVIGLPNDKIDIKADGDIYINDELIIEDYIASPGAISGSYEVPNDSYFFLGDNRENSLDSRYWINPYINKDNIMGRAAYRYYPFNKIANFK